MPRYFKRFPCALRRSERILFMVLAVFIWPFIAVGVVAGWGFLVWMYYAFTGRPGPV
nr:periplasmic nitrate reductase, NapE protein [Rhodoplanes elegans]